MMNKLHGIIFAYRSNPNLRELTQPRNTCSVPYGGRYRVIDFMLSNMVNAGITDVGLIAHANYQSLLDHVGSGKDWDLSRKHGGLRILPPFSYADKRGDGSYRGRMAPWPACTPTSRTSGRTLWCWPAATWPSICPCGTSTPPM